jgi:hypothetical protein
MISAEALPPYVVIERTSMPEENIPLGKAPPKKLKPLTNFPFSGKHPWELEEYRSPSVSLDEERLLSIMNFAATLAKDSRSLDPEFAKVLDREFWNLL